MDSGPYLLEALRSELKDVRTWETQYQMIMAIGECGYKEALPFIIDLSGREFEATMIFVAIGDAIVRLTRNENDASSVIDFLESKNDMLIDGALRAMAMLRMIPSEEQILQIIKFVSKYAVDEGIRFWVIAAAPGWSGSAVESFLDQSIHSTRNEFIKAAELAKKKKYYSWNPL